MAHDYDWLVIGSGFGGSVVGAAPAREGLLGRRARVRPAVRRRRAAEARPGTCGATSGRRGSGCAGSSGSRSSRTSRSSAAPASAAARSATRTRSTARRRRFYEDPQWAGLADWEAALAPHYDEAERMLGVVAYDEDDPADDLLREYAREIGVGGHVRQDARRRVPRRSPARRSPDPYFGGAGPGPHGLPALRALHDRLPARRQEHAGQELPVARRARGRARSLPERMVVDVRPLGAADGSEGYEVTTERPGAWLRRDRRTFTARGVVVAAGALGTNRLLAACKLARLAAARSRDRLGELVRTNSEAILAVTLPARRARHHAPRRDHRLDLPRPRHAHRDRRLRRRGRLDELALHACWSATARASRGR